MARPSIALLVLVLALVGFPAEDPTAPGPQIALAQQEPVKLPAISVVRVSTDPTYGFTETNPIQVGGVADGPPRERAYLDQLRGPAGQPLQYQRLGSCCPFDTPNGISGGGLLDIYEVWHAGLKAPVQLYINMYDYAAPEAPVGFTVAR